MTKLKIRYQSTAFMSHNGRVVIIICYDEGLKNSKHSARGNQHVKTNMSLSFLLGESEPWLLAFTAGILCLLLVVHLILSIGGQRRQPKPEDENISRPAQVDPQIEVEEVGQQNTTKGVQLARNINRTASHIR